MAKCLWYRDTMLAYQISEITGGRGFRKSRYKHRREETLGHVVGLFQAARNKGRLVQSAEGT
jgi:hypothetical protein